MNLKLHNSELKRLAHFMLPIDMMKNAVQQKEQLSLLGASGQAAESGQTTGSLSPMLQQYFTLKAEAPDCLLFFRLGDFYELFFEDARIAAPILDVALTRRGQHEGAEIPMCGVPAHAHEIYLAKLIRAGQRVAICEQTEDPAAAKARGNKSVVRREIVRLVTAGTLTEDGLLDAQKSHFLAALVWQNNAGALALTDLSDPCFQLYPIAGEALPALLARFSPREIILSENAASQTNVRAALAALPQCVRQVLPAGRFDAANAKARLLAHYGVAALSGFGDFSQPEITAGGVLLDYLSLTQRGALQHLPAPQSVQAPHLQMDAATRRNLELTETQNGARMGSLLATIDCTQTQAGSRLLAQWLAAPLLEMAAISARHDALDFWLGFGKAADAVLATLRSLPDCARALGRLSLARATPRDLACVRANLEGAEKLLAILSPAAGSAPSASPPLSSLPEILENSVAALRGFSGLRGVLQTALAAEPPARLADGGVIAAGYHAALDELRGWRDDSRRLIAELQARYARETGLSNLKIRYNDILGYFVELTQKDADKLLQSATAEPFRHRQTLANSVRFSTVELSSLAQKITESASRALALEAEIFQNLVGEILKSLQPLLALASALAVLDVTLALALLAKKSAFVRPEMLKTPVLHIQQGRHVVVEAQPQRTRFTANDFCCAEAKLLWLLTGPNMAGKSTFLRQNALMVILAQMGSFVPATAAKIGLVDKLFSRVGAADDLARGQSTFMVEMLETALILNQATAQSLVILDEIGRGTATHDGMAIAQAVLEDLHQRVQCRALFATHYHELTALQKSLPRLHCAMLAVLERADEIVFLHQVVAGEAQRSYGLHVARLAGMPKTVLRRAAEILQALEAQGTRTLETPHSATKFANIAEPSPPPSSDETDTLSKIEPLLAALRELDPDALSPKEALAEIYKLREMLHV